METGSDENFNVTKPVNFDPSNRPRRQDLKVLIYQLYFENIEK